MLKPNIMMKIVKNTQKKVSLQVRILANPGYKLCSIQRSNINFSPILKDMLWFNEVSEIL